MFLGIPKEEEISKESHSDDSDSSVSNSGDEQATEDGKTQLEESGDSDSDNGTETEDHESQHEGSNDLDSDGTETEDDTSQSAEPNASSKIDDENHPEGLDGPSPISSVDQGDPGGELEDHERPKRLRKRDGDDSSYDSDDNSDERGEPLRKKMRK